MSQQMSLFASEDMQHRTDAMQTTEGNALDEMFAASRRFRSSHEYIELLNFIARFPKYSAFNGCLLFIQNPACRFVATAGTWRKRFNRYPKPGARPLIILAPMSPVQFVFDVSDTEGDFLPPEIIDRARNRSPLTKAIFDNTVHNCGVSGILVRQMRFNDDSPEAPIPITPEAVLKFDGLAMDTRMSHLILLRKDSTRQTRYAELSFELAQVFCGHHGSHPSAWWQDRRKGSPTARAIEAISVAYLICRRKGLIENAETYLSRLGGMVADPAPPGLNAVITATSYIEEMGKSRWKKPKKQGR